MRDYVSLISSKAEKDFCVERHPFSLSLLLCVYVYMCVYVHVYVYVCVCACVYVLVCRTQHPGLLLLETKCTK